MKASLSSIVYDLAINGKINEPLSQEMMDCFRKLAGMANNLNQLAHEAHIAGYEDVAAADRLLSEKIDEVLNKLNHNKDTKRRTQKQTGNKICKIWQCRVNSEFHLTTVYTAAQ